MSKNKSCSCNDYYTCRACRSSTIYTYAEIGDLLGISHQRVQQIERRALQKFKDNLKLLGYNSIEEVL